MCPQTTNAKAERAREHILFTLQMPIEGMPWPLSHSQLVAERGPRLNAHTALETAPVGSCNSPLPPSVLRSPHFPHPAPLHRESSPIRTLLIAPESREPWPEAGRLGSGPVSHELRDPRQVPAPRPASVPQQLAATSSLSAGRVLSSKKMKVEKAGTGYGADYRGVGVARPSGWCDGVLESVDLRTPTALCPESPQQLWSPEARDQA